MADDRLRLRGQFSKKTKIKRSRLATYRNTHKNQPDALDHNYTTPTSPVILPTSPVVQVENAAANIDVDETNELNWTQGRRIVELSVLAEQMSCKTCNVPLHLKDIIREIRFTFKII